MEGRRTVIVAFAALVAIAAVVGLVGGGSPDAFMRDPLVLLALTLIVLGEVLLVQQFGRQSAPISTAAAMALVLTPVESQGLTWAQCVVRVALAMMVGLSLRRAMRRPSVTVDLAGRFLGVATTAAVVRVDLGSGTIIGWVADASTPRLLAVTVLLAGALAGVVTKVLLRTMAWTASFRVPARALIRHDLNRSGALGAITTHAGPLTAITEPTLGAWALILFTGPIAMALMGLRRAERIDDTHRQLVLALARLTDETGHTVEGHAPRVARLAMQIGTDLGLGPIELADLQDAALLHDVGQVTLSQPIPDGATTLAAPAVQEAVLERSVTLAEHAGASEGVMSVITASGTPYRQLREEGRPIPLASRVLKIANAYDDLTHGRHNARGPALERIQLGLGYEYDPSVVDALTRVTATPDRRMLLKD